MVPDRFAPVLADLAPLAERFQAAGRRLYLVGGTVRDLLIGREAGDIDATTDARPSEIKSILAGWADAVWSQGERFGTIGARHRERDYEITTHRAEAYVPDSRKPEVVFADGVEVDLSRRDFTVNAMAVRLTDGEMTAWDAAEDDLRAGILRVLHERSFIDDPTRILRLLRYSARLGFDPDPATDALIDPGGFATVSGDRLGRELRLLLDEPHPARQLERHGIGEALLPGFLPVDIDASPLAKLAACCTGVEDLSQRLDDLGFTAHDRKIVVAAARAPAVPDSDAELWRAFRRLPPEAAEVAGARRWLDEVRHRTLAITGDDLVAAGVSGAAVGEALERATVAMLDGNAPDRESQLAAALG